MGAIQDFKKAQAEIQRQKSLLARGKASGNQTLINAANANIRVLEGRATTAFQQVAREAAIKAQARAKAAQAQQRQREAAIAQQKRAEAARQVKQRESQARAKLPGSTVKGTAEEFGVPKPLTSRQRALQLRQRTEAARKEKSTLEKAKLAEAKRAKSVFESEKIQSEVGPAFESGEAFNIAGLEKRREAAIEKVKATKSVERLESGTTVFETGAGFDPVSLESGKGQKIARDEQKIAPKTSEGIFISGQVQSQLVDNIDDVLTIEKQISAIKTEIPGTPQFSRDLDDPDSRGGVAALQIFKEQKGIEAVPDLFPGSTVRGTAEEFGVAVKTKEKFDGETFVFPALSGTLIGDVEKPSEIARRTGEDPFEVAQGLREETGLIPGQPIKFGELVGFDIPKKPTKRPTKTTVSKDPLLAVQQPGLQFRSAEELRIETGFIPFAQPISQPKTPKRGKSKVFLSPVTPAFIASPATVVPSAQNFGSFLSDLGGQFNISADLFSTVSSGLSFGNIFGRKTLPPRRQTASQKKASAKAKAAGQIATLKRQGRAVPSSLIAQAFPDKSARAKAAGFQVSSSGQIFEGRRSKGTFTGLKGSSVAQVKSKRADIIRIAAEKRAKIAAEKRRVAAEKRARQIRKRQKKGRSKGARAPSSQVSIFGGSGSIQPTVSRVTKPSAQKRGTQKSQDFISGLTSSPGTDRFGFGPSGSQKKPKKPGKSTPGIFGGGFGGGRRFG